MSDMIDSAGRGVSWRTVRQRRRRFVFAFVISFLLVYVGANWMPYPVIRVGLSVALIGWTMNGMIRSRCPRCRLPFYNPVPFIALFQQRCVHCKTRLGQAVS